MIEPLPLEEHFRAKREIEAQSDDDFLVVIYETAASGARRCGLQSQNRKRLYAPDLLVHKLRQEEPDFERRKRSTNSEVYFKNAGIWVIFT